MFGNSTQNVKYVEWIVLAVALFSRSTGIGVAARCRLRALCPVRPDILRLSEWSEFYLRPPSRFRMHDGGSRWNCAA